ncbi:MAG: rhomboid family intramembrane serine protease [Mycobacterium sp.]|nr:rhomboid family intramembrane serine protease [Mycobacterium sp.]
MTYPYPPQTPPGAPVCYRHPDRPTYVGCARCGRPVCGECMRSAAVGHQCVDCVAAAAAVAPAPRTGSWSPQRTGGTPVVSYALIAVNVAVFVMQLASRGLETKLSLWPPAVAGGDYYRLITSAFLHYGIVHIAFNMYALYVLGPPLEEHLGKLRFAGLYGLSALGGSVVVYLFSPLNAATAGASGAIFGLFGATLVGAKRLNLDVRWLVGLIVINLVITFTVPGISWQGHMGGLITGAAVAAAYVYPPPARRTLIQAGATVGLLLVFGALISWRTAAIINQFGVTLGH